MLFKSTFGTQGTAAAVHYILNVEHDPQARTTHPGRKVGMHWVTNLTPGRELAELETLIGQRRMKQSQNHLWLPTWSLAAGQVLSGGQWEEFVHRLDRHLPLTMTVEGKEAACSLSELAAIWVVHENTAYQHLQPVICLIHPVWRRPVKIARYWDRVGGHRATRAVCLELGLAEHPAMPRFVRDATGLWVHENPRSTQGLAKPGQAAAAQHRPVQPPQQFLATMLAFQPPLTSWEDFSQRLRDCRSAWQPYRAGAMFRTPEGNVGAAQVGAVWTRTALEAKWGKIPAGLCLGTTQFLKPKRAARGRSTTVAAVGEMPTVRLVDPVELLLVDQAGHRLPALPGHHVLRPDELYTPEHLGSLQALAQNSESLWVACRPQPVAGQVVLSLTLGRMPAWAFRQLQDEQPNLVYGIRWEDQYWAALFYPGLTVDWESVTDQPADLLAIRRDDDYVALRRLHRELARRYGADLSLGPMALLPFPAWGGELVHVTPLVDRVLTGVDLVRHHKLQRQDELSWSRGVLPKILAQCDAVMTPAHETVIYRAHVRDLHDHWGQYGLPSQRLATAEELDEVIAAGLEFAGQTRTELAQLFSTVAAEVHGFNPKEAARYGQRLATQTQLSEALRPVELVQATADCAQAWRQLTRQAELEWEDNYAATLRRKAAEKAEAALEFLEMEREVEQPAPTQGPRMR